MLQLQLSTATPASIRSTGAGASAIILSANTIAENAALGAAVGTLSTIGTTGTAAFTLVDSAGSRFALSGANVQRGATALDYETATSHNIIVSVSGVTPTISNATLAISVTNIAEVPVNSVAPTLSPTSGAVGTLITCVQGTWSNTPTSYVYQWMKGGVDISGATSSTYTSLLADDLTTLTCKVLASNADGPGAGYVTTSNSHSVGASASPPLDSYTVGVAYSLRKMRTAYAGNCIRIRRSSDNAEQNIGFVSDVVDTASIASFVGGGSGFIVTWYDQSGNAVDVTHATAASQPLYVASGMNGKPTARFDGTDDGLASASAALTTVTAANQTTIMFAQNQDGTKSDNTTFNFTAAAGIWIFATIADTIYLDWGNGTTGRVSGAQPSGWDNAAHITEMYRTTANSQGILVDGASIATGSPGAGDVPSGNGFLVFGHASGNAYFKGDQAEFFILKTDVGSSPRATTRANMGAYYGVTVA